MRHRPGYGCPMNDVQPSESSPGTAALGVFPSGHLPRLVAKVILGLISAFGLAVVCGTWFGAPLERAAARAARDLHCLGWISGLLGAISGHVTLFQADPTRPLVLGKDRRSAVAGLMAAVRTTGLLGLQTRSRKKEASSRVSVP